MKVERKYKNGNLYVVQIHGNKIDEALVKK